jgi:RND family efflux transporter MFP subunit
VFRIRSSAIRALVLLGASGSLLACAEEPPPKPVRPVVSMKVEGAGAFQGRWWPGRAKATQEVDLGFEVAGQLQERVVDVGDEVEAGDVMARLDCRDFQNQLTRAKAELERATAYFERVEQASRTGAVSRQEVDDARAREDQAQATLRIRQKAVDDCTMVAPFDGLVSATYVDNFTNVRKKQPVVRVLDVSRLEMIINVPEDLINYSSQVEGLSVRFDALPGVEMPARIKEIGREASQATRTFPVTIIFDPTAAGVQVQPGMAGEAKATSQLQRPLPTEGVELPTSAVFTPDGEETQDSFVWVVDEAAGTVQRRKVEPVRITQRGSTLVRGVEVGERVVTKGVHRLREGQEVLVP